MLDEEFFTFRELMKKEDNALSASMEDYLEMIYRVTLKTGYTRVSEIASILNVQPPSVSKMIQKLAELNLLDYKKYDIIRLTKKGSKIGKSLLHRHNVVENFLRLIGVTSGLLDETERIEHTISIETLKKLDNLVEFMKKNPEFLKMFIIFQNSKEIIQPQQ